MKPTKSKNGFFSTNEKKVHTRFAIQAAKSGGWDSTAEAFLAMQRECSARSLRACNFRHFRSRIRVLQGYHLFWSPRSYWVDLSNDTHENTPRASSVSSLLRALDHSSICGW